MLEDFGSAEMTISWNELIPVLCVSPGAASLKDIMRLATEYMEARAGLIKISQTEYQEDGYPTKESEMAQEILADIDKE